MADQKLNIAELAGSHEEQHSISEPLFDEEPLDLETHGGLVVLDNGQVAEVTPTRFIPEGGDTGLTGRRVQPLPFEVTEEEDGRAIRWREEPYDPNAVTIGLEIESLTMRCSDATWWNISEDGRTLRYPHTKPGEEEPAERRGHQGELLKNTTEDGSPVEQLSRGYPQVVGNAARQKYNKQAWMHDNGLMAVPLSAYPESVSDRDISDHPYRKMLRQVMPHILEYAVCLSEQINIQWKSPEAGAFALNAYEMLSPVLGLVTASSPGRDGSLSTTLSQHYEHNPDFAIAPNAADYKALGEQVRHDLEAFMGMEPYDWRELARGYGSVGGGVITQPAQADLEGLLREGDRQLRQSESMTINRMLGSHTNRWRADRDVVEIGNLSLGGDHPDKMAAAEETVIKAIIALQEYYTDTEAEEKYDINWLGIIPPPYERDDMASRQRQVDIGRINTMVFTLFGKDRNLLDMYSEERTPTEIFDTFADFIACYAPEPLSPQTLGEIRATLKQPPEYDNTYSINDPLADFFRRNSTLTATEAIRRAQPLDNMDPPIRLTHVIRRFARYAYDKRMERHAAGQREEDEAGAA